MIITRKKRIPLHWAFYAQLPLLLSIYGQFVMNAPFLLMMKRFIDNPAAIMGLISIEVYVTIMGSPFINWLSDRIWTKWGRRKIFMVLADASSGIILLLMPFAPNLITLIILRWLFGAIRDLGAVTQALAYEVVPAPQRGKSSGYFQAMIQIGNIVFFFLVLGRFDDVYFMGPFASVMDVSGGTIMFWLAAMLLLGIAMFQALGFKEILPPGRKRLNDDRKGNELFIIHFVRAFLKDVFSKDLSPLYLLLFLNAMFGISLGIFQPLLYTEQWGYSLQQMGNTMAVTATFAVVVGLTTGWFADRFGKMEAFLLALTASFVVNLAFTIFVYFQPDHRPSIFEIIVFGNIGLVFNMVKGVVSFPLMMEFVKRNRMGAAGAGIQLVNGVLRNTMTLFVGLWLVWWSVWFLPQAGYNVAPTFAEPVDSERLVEKLKAADINTDELILRPIHQYGIDGEVSPRWWIHRNTERVDELLRETKSLKNEIERLSNKLDSPYTREQERDRTQTELDQALQRLEAIDAELSEGSRQLHDYIVERIRPMLHQPGSQILEASLDDFTLRLRLDSLEPLNRENAENLERVLAGPEHARLAANSPENGVSSRRRAAIEVQPSSDGQTGFAVQMQIDPEFLTLYRAGIESGWPHDSAYELASIISSICRSILGYHEIEFSLENIEITHSSASSSDVQLDVVAASGATQGPFSILAEALREESHFSNAATEIKPEAVRFMASIPHASATQVSEKPIGADEAMERIRALVGDRPVAYSLLHASYLKVVDAAAAEPVYVTVPKHEVEARYQEREYEYFFSSKVLELSTDIFGFLIAIFIIILERRGTIHRYGVEEDLNR